MAEVYQLKYLTGRRLKVFLAVADRIVPADAEGPGAGNMATAGVVDWALGRIDPALRSQILMLLIALEFLGVLFGGRPFTRNSAAAQDRELKFLENSPVRVLRLGFFGIKSYACMGYYAREDTWKSMGYEGPLVPDRPFPDDVVRALCQGRIEVVA
ncbi:MAG TPA: hypothetical protein VM658_11970 [bacterium]|nr:hypothetical protein [bacterium]